VGVSRQSLHAWLARYEAEGLEGLLIGRGGRDRVYARSAPRSKRWWPSCGGCPGIGRRGEIGHELVRR
jgi:hypothetical protein